MSIGWKCIGLSQTQKTHAEDIYSLSFNLGGDEQ